MADQQATRWQDWTNVVFGIWLFLSPFILGYSIEGGAAAWNHYILGIAVTVFAIIALYDTQVWEEWINLILGAWLIISPFILGFTEQPAALWNSIILGILIGGDSLWAIQKPRPTLA